MNKTWKKILLLMPLLLAIVGFGYFLNLKQNQLNSTPILPLTYRSSSIKINRFKTDSDLKDYLAKNSSVVSAGYSSRQTNALAPEAVGTMKSTDTTTGQAADRVSSTNVQIVGIDEPDIVKTDGQNIYFNRTNNFIYSPLDSKSTSSMIMPSRNTAANIQTIKAFPPTKIELGKVIEDQGDMLLAQKSLIVFGSNKVSGYDISDPNNPQQKWSLNYNENNYFNTARLFNNQIYLVTKKSVDINQPCPLEPFSGLSQSISIKCTDIYYPSVENTDADTFYTIAIIDPVSGEISQTTTFLGSAANSTIYMSKNNIYLTYTYSGDYINYILGFFKANPDLTSSSLTVKLEKLQGYDISSQAKMTELQTLIAQMLNSLTNDERLQFNNDFQNKIKSYQNIHLRELEFTGIAKFAASDLSFQSNGSIPGQLLNQFSLDEYEGNLRIATTISSNGMYFGLPVNKTDSTNDVYVLGDKLNIIGSALDLGKGERIYSARFIYDKGYLVTFKQTDPFFVLDLTNPRLPKMVGELKIPGFSSYLHPLTDNLILGVGQEDNKVKVSLFDVTRADNPVEIDKYNLDEYWTEVQSNHHAFLQDSDNKIFFLPGGKGGYIFSYNQQKLNLTKAVSVSQVKRALYLNNYLYIVSDSNIVAYDETNWKKINQIDFPGSQYLPTNGSAISPLKTSPSTEFNKPSN